MKKIIARTIMLLSAFGFAFAASPKEKIITNGWADAGKLSYADESKKIVIDDAAYPDPVSKRKRLCVHRSERRNRP